MVFRFTLLFVASLNFTFTSVFSQDEDEYLLWGKTSNRPEYTGTIVNQSDLDTDNNLYVVGTFYKGFPLEQDPSQISSVLQLFIHKYDSNGNLLWSREYGTEAYPSYAGDIRVDKNGDIIFTGYLRDLGGSVFGQPNEGFFISKLDKHGSLIWVKPLTRTNLFTWGERVGVFGKQSKMEIDKDNSIVVYLNGNPLGSPGDFFSGLYISRYSSEGNLIHQYQITHDDNFNTPGLGGLAIDNDGNLIITGYYNFGLKIGGIILGHTSDAVRLFLAKFTMTGDLLWAKTTDGLSAGSDVDVDEIGNIYFTGVAPGHATFGDGKQLNPSDYDPAFVAKLNSNGQIIWSKSLVARPISLKWTSLGNL